MKLTLVSSCIALVAMALAVEAAPSGKKLAIPLARNDEYKPSAKRAVARARAKYAKHAIHTSHSNHTINPLQNVPADALIHHELNARSGSVPVTDYSIDIEYYGVVGVGTPAQKFKINFDTGSSDLWLASTLCSTCTSHTRYNPSASSSYVADGRAWSISYGDGSTASGILAYDTVNLGGLVIKKQSIELAKKESSSFASNPIDGLLGLGFDSITTVAGIKTPVDNLISQGLISSPVYGVYLGKASLGGGGEYIFGGYDSSKFTGSLTTIPVDKSLGYWTVTAGKIAAGSTTIATSSYNAIIDTGTTLLLFPKSIAAKVASAYGAYDNGDGTYTISCSITKPLYLSLGGVAFKVPAESLIFEQDGSSCIAGFGYADLSFAIFGDVFIKNNYVIFDQTVPEVKIAPSINNS